MYKKTILALSIILASNSSSATPFTDYYNVIEDEYYPSSYKDIEQATTYKDAVIQGMLINSDFLIDFLNLENGEYLENCFRLANLHN